MKHSIFMPLLAVIMLFAPRICEGQKIQKVLGSYQASGTISVLDSTASHLYLKALKWLASGDTYGNYLFEGSDVDARTLKCKGWWDMSLFLNSGQVEHTLRLKAKDGAVEYVFHAFVFESAGSGRTRFDGPMAGKKGAIAKTEKEIALTVEQLTLWLRRSGKG